MAKTKRIEEGGADYPANAPEELKNLESFRYSSKSTQRKMIRDYSKREKTEAKDRAYLETVPEELRGSESFRASSRKEQRKRVKEYNKKKYAAEKEAVRGDRPIHERTGGSIRKQAGGSMPVYDPDWKAKKKAAIAKKQKTAKTVRKGKQAKRKASRSPGGFAGGGAIESYSAQVQRKYGGGKV